MSRRHVVRPKNNLSTQKNKNSNRRRRRRQQKQETEGAFHFNYSIEEKKRWINSLATTLEHKKYNKIRHT